MTDDTPTVRGIDGRGIDARDHGEPAGAGSDRYEPGGELGRGGMGRVVDAKDTMLDRAVALKEALSTDEEALRRFAREVKITARLEHPSIVPVYDAGVSATGSPFYVMRKVTGRPLDKLVTDSFDERLALLPHVVAACHAIAHAHERGIIHRDLKPSNILVGARGETVVIDWGLAKALDERDEPAPEQPGLAGEGTTAPAMRTRAGVVFGTPGYMAPEQLRTADVDERADVYALGATLFYMLARRAPHVGATPDDMEAAAASGPPPPISDVAPGVPRELRAIVDKALSYDLATRYPNAGALAEDLSRFMTGQLVAAHDYSTGEKIARFVRRHRTQVITAGAALAILIGISTVLVARIIAARDDAVLQAAAADRARARETERASDLVISQARTLVATNPAAALAMVRPFASSPRWREVRAIAAGARAAGVPWRYPGPAAIASGGLSFEGNQAVATDEDGTIHLYDLRTRTHRVLATVPTQKHTAFLDETHLIGWKGRTFTVIDAQTSAQQTFEHAAAIVTVDCYAGFAYFVDVDHRAWRLDVATKAIAPIPIDGRVDRVAVSPGGKLVALAGDNLWVTETKNLALVELVHPGKKFELAWSFDDHHIATIGPTSMFDIALHPEVDVHEYMSTNQSIALARGVLYSAGLSGVIVGVARRERSDGMSAILGIYVTQDEYVVMLEPEALRVFDGEHDLRVPLPATPCSLLRASPRAPFIFATCGGEVLVWNVNEIMPRHIEVPSYTQLATIGPHEIWMVLGSNTGEPRAIDAHTLELRSLDPTITSSHWTAPASGAWVIIRPLNRKQTLLLLPDGKWEPLPIDALFVRALDDRTAAIATRTNEIVLLDIPSKTTQPVATLPARIAGLYVREASSRWIVAALDNETLWRRDLSTGKVTQIALALPRKQFSPGPPVTPARTDGDVFFGDGARVRRWKVDGSVEDHAVLPTEMLLPSLVDDTTIVAFATNYTAYKIALDRPREIVKLVPIGTNFTWSDAAPPLLVADDRTKGVVVIDVEANLSWRVALSTPTGMTPIITGDGTVVAMRDAQDDARAIALWNLDLPQGPAATADWVAHMTNATFDPKTGVLGWLP